jgi:hypothetical protein
VVSLKKWLDNHPGPIALGIAVSVATTTAAITTYFTDQLHKAEQAQVENKHLSEVSDLKNRLSSIERRAGPEQSKRYVDVQSMQVSQSEVRNLADQFRSFDDGSFFLNAPKNQDWTYEFLSLPQSQRLGAFKLAFEQSNYSPELLATLEQNKQHVWYSKPAAESRYAFGSGELTLGGPLRSNVRIQKITREQVVANASAAAGAGGKWRSQSETKNVESTIDQIERLKKEASQDDSADSETKGLFEHLYNGDTAGLVFVDILIQHLLIGMGGPNVSFGIVSAQKQLNVMYVDLELRLSRTKIEKSYDDSCKEGSGPTIVIRREIFFVSYGSGAYLIWIEVPTCDGRSKAFEWISQWLTGLRLVVKSIG